MARGVFVPPARNGRQQGWGDMAKNWNWQPFEAGQRVRPKNSDRCGTVRMVVKRTPEGVSRMVMIDWDDAQQPRNQLWSTHGLILLDEPVVPGTPPGG